MQQLPELLAPAGDKSALLAALQSGADAVYFGVEKFNARRNASNFMLQNLSETCDLVHLAGARAYLTLNTEILPEEVDDAVELARQAWYRGVDALIVQDLGLMRTLSTVLPQMELHTSTQMNIHNSEGIRLAAQLGAKRVTLARELTTDELAELTKVAGELGVELEIFAHGALCICYSGQCLMSSMVGTRSANRGLCAQPCRLPYKLIDTSTGKTVNVEGDFPLSPADLNTIDMLDSLVTTGIASLKIEGRMKDSAYVATVTAAYRAVLDELAGKQKNGEPADRSTLSDVFNRGYAQAYLKDGRGNVIMSHQRPDNRAYAAGLDTNWTEESFFAANHGLVDVTASVRAVIGEPLEIGFSVGAGADLRPALDGTKPAAANGSPEIRYSVTAKGPNIEAARTKSLTKTDIIDHVGRVGGTPFSISDWQIKLDDGVGIGFSTLHKVRNAALEQLRMTMLASWHERKLSKTQTSPLVRHRESTRPQVACIVASDAVARVAHKSGAALVWRANVEYLPQIMHDYQSAQVLTQIAKTANKQPFVVNNLGQISAFAACNPPKSWVAGPALNITNSATVATLAQLGASDAWLSPELTLAQIQQLASQSALPLTLTVYGQQQLMVTEHCILMSQGPCAENCANCARRKAPRLLEDRKGYRLPLWTDDAGRSHIHNAVTLDIVPAIPELLAAGVTRFVVDATLLSTKEATEQIERAIRALKVAQLNGASLKKQEGSTTGHLYRAVE